MCTLFPSKTMLIYLLFQTFYANSDPHSIHHNTLSPPLIGKSLRLNPYKYYGAIEFRMELNGCEYNGASRKFYIYIYLINITSLMVLRIYSR